MKSSESDSPTVTIIYRWIPGYRVAFYRALRAELASRGIELRLVYGQPDRELQRRNDAAGLDWAEYRKNSYLYLPGGRTLVWQQGLGAALHSDLVIVEQASKLLLNYLLLVASWLGLAKVAYWGHGRNFQLHSASAVAESVKRFMSRRVDWWFAYNDSSVRLVAALGYPVTRITNVMNSTDTKLIRETVQSLSSGALPVGPRRCVFMGGIYADKRVDVAVEAVRLARESIAGLELVIIGDGPLRSELSNEYSAEQWVHFLGPRFGHDLAAHLAACSLVVLPGAVGLAVVDAFAAGLPVLTQVGDAHGPEFDYLRAGVNSVVLEADADAAAYADAINQVLADADYQERLAAGAREWGARLSVESMAERFADGVERALATS